MVTAGQIRFKPNPRYHGDDIPVYFGSSQDSRITYDAANDEWTVQTKDAGGTFQDRFRIEANTNTPDADLVDVPLKWTAGRAVTAGDYSAGRDAGGTNQLHINVPTGAAFEFSVNDVAQMTLSATEADFLDNVIKSDGDLDIKSGLFQVDVSEDIVTVGSPGITNAKLAVKNDTAETYLFNFMNSAGNSQVRSTNAGNLTEIFYGVKLKGSGGSTEIDGDLNHDGSNVGLYGVAPAGQASKISDPSGGGTVDAEARTAINSIIDALEGIGISASA